MKVKEESEKVGLKVHIQKTKIMPSSPITSWQIDEETIGTVKGFIFLVSKIIGDSDCNREIKRCLLIASWETYMQVRKQQLELDMEQQTGSK